MVAYTVYIVHIKLSNAGVCASQQHKEVADGCICSDHRGVILRLFFFFVVMYAGLIFLSVQPARKLSTEMMGNVGNAVTLNIRAFSPEYDSVSLVVN